MGPALAQTLCSQLGLKGDGESRGQEGTEGSRRSPSTPDTEGRGCGPLATGLLIPTLGHTQPPGGTTRVVDLNTWVAKSMTCPREVQMVMPK